VKALPERLRISIGGHFGPSYSVKLDHGRLTYTCWPRQDSSSQELEEFSPELRELLGLKPLPQPEQIQPSAKQWKAFRKELDRLNVWCWQANYSDPTICDGNWLVR
jgi:hypothetical protein